VIRRIALFAVLAAAFVLGLRSLEAHARTGTQRTASAVASELAGRPVAVRCQSLWADLFSVNGNLGEVRFDANGRPADDAWLTRATCKRLQRFVSSRGADLQCLKLLDWSRFQWNAPHDACVDRATRIGQAVVTLAHESMHLRGIASESQAQCGAERAVPLVVVRLGADPMLGQLLQRLARAWNSSMPTDYQTTCTP
jgi:hypothetical protein